jgi:hypothetical protein
VSGRKSAPVVSREYRSDPNSCLHALELLLKKPINKAVRPTPEPDGRDGTKSKEDSASDILPR